MAQPAIQGGFHVAAQIAAPVDGRPTEPFHYNDKGSMATIGRNQAVAEFPNGMRFHGLIGWLMWLGLHLVVPDRLPQPRERARQLGVELPHLRPQRANTRRVDEAADVEVHRPPECNGNLTILSDFGSLQFGAVQHIGIVACSAEGAALCYQAICREALTAVGKNDHPRITIDSIPLAAWMPAFDAGDYAAVGGDHARFGAAAR